MFAKTFWTAFIVALIHLPGGAYAHDYRVGDLIVYHPWVVQPPNGTSVASGLLTIENTGKISDRLVSVAIEVAGKVEIHSTVVSEGVAAMRTLKEGVEIPAGASVELHGSRHLMLMELKRPLLLDETLQGTLTFEKAGTLQVEFLVESLSMKNSHPGHRLKKTP